MFRSGKPFLFSLISVSVLAVLGEGPITKTPPPLDGKVYKVSEGMSPADDGLLSLPSSGVTESAIRVAPLEGNVEIAPGATAHSDYDFESVMHYGQCAFSVCQDCPLSSSYQDVIGQRERLSSGDEAVLAFLYAAYERAKLTASDRAAGDQFGHAVSMSGDVAVTGASLHDDTGTDSGSAYVYRFDGIEWQEEAQLTAVDGAAGDWFGHAVSISGDVAVIGARADDDAGTNSGSAYVYRFDGTDWIREAKLTAWDAAAGDAFGQSVSISANAIVIGAPGDNDSGESSGSAYVFRYDSETQHWIREAKLTAADAAAGDAFGLSNSLSGDVVVSGAPGDDHAGESSGSAYVFGYDPDTQSRMEQTKLTAFDGAAGDEFGISVALWGDTALVGADRDDDRGTDSGSAYVVDLGCPRCDPCDTNCDGSVDLTDVEPFIELLLGGDPCAECTGDTNNDGSVDLLDVEGFIGCLLG